MPINLDVEYGLWRSGTDAGVEYGLWRFDFFLFGR